MVFLLLYDPSVVVGLVFIVAVVWRWFVVPADARRCEYLLLITIYTLIVTPVAQAFAESLSEIRPMKMDLYAYVADGTLGQPAFVLGRMVAPHVWAQALLNVAYGLLPIGMILTLGAHVLRRSAGVSVMVWAFVINLLAAPMFYLLVPVCGPLFAFPMFPLGPGHVTPHTMRIDAAPNGVPSVHMSTALLMVWFGRRSRAGLTAAIVYLLLIVLSTLASGQHYAVDLVAAVPYTAGVLWLAKVAASELRVPQAEAAEESPGR
jgi:PAP2 superfamily